MGNLGGNATCYGLGTKGKEEENADTDSDSEVPLLQKGNGR